MKRHFLIILMFVIGIAFSNKVNVSSLNINVNTEDSCISDTQSADIDMIFNAASDNVFVPEIQNSLPAPSFRLISSQKKTQQNPINNILLKRFSPEACPTKNYNIKFSFPLSSKDDLIVIVRHLII